MTDSVDRSAVLTDDRQKTPIKLNFNKMETNIENKDDFGILQISSSSTIGKVNDECDIDIYGDDLLIAFNHRYLYESLRAVKDEKIMIKLESTMKSLIILPYDEEIGNSQHGMNIDGSKFLYLVLPIRMRE